MRSVAVEEGVEEGGSGARVTGVWARAWARGAWTAVVASARAAMGKANVMLFDREHAASPPVDTRERRRRRAGLSSVACSSSGSLHGEV